MHLGTVRWFNPTKGYGFISPDDRWRDVFVNIDAVKGSGLCSLVAGQKVQFDIRAERNGRECAVNLLVQ